jgi:hypothetical protein
MKHISFTPRFVNEAGDDLVPGKIHTIRQNYAYWKKFEGRDLELFAWEGKPCRSKQKVFCVKRLVYVQRVYIWVNVMGGGNEMLHIWSMPEGFSRLGNRLNCALFTKNDGFENEGEFIDWFLYYPFGEMAILHFTDFRYGV